MDVVVIGSVNMDYIVSVDTPPGPGETVLARALVKSPGGKGANQAFAAARMGARVRLVAALGDDEDGGDILRQLRAEGIDTSAVEIVSHQRTGVAFVSVFASGENSITVVPAANHAVSPQRVQHYLHRGDAANRIVLLQGELREDVTMAVAKAVRDAGGRLVINLAPYAPLTPSIVALAHPLVLNQAEAHAMIGRSFQDVTTAERGVLALARRATSVVVTLGALGAVWASGRRSAHVPAPSIPSVLDTTGAGDAFVGALAAELALGSDLAAATRSGVAAGTFAVAQLGAQLSYPSRQQLVEFLAPRVSAEAEN